MKSKALLASILFLAVMLAGCASESTDTDPGPGTEQQPAGEPDVQNLPDPAEPAEPAPVNRVPTASLLANATNGTAPLNITFTLDGADADGDNLTWELLVNGTAVANGSELPFDVIHVFEAGTYNVTLVVSDGSLVGNAATTLHVAEVATYAGPAAIQWSGSAVTGDREVVLGCIVWDSSDDSSYLDFDASYGGVWLFKALGTPTIGHLATEWWAGDSQVTGSAVEGVIPVGADNVAVCSDTQLDPVDFALVLYHPDDPAYA